MTTEDDRYQMDRLRAENERLRAAVGSAIIVLQNAPIIRFPDEHSRFLKLANAALDDCRTALGTPA